MFGAGFSVVVDGEMVMYRDLHFADGEAAAAEASVTAADEPDAKKPKTGEGSSST